MRDPNNTAQSTSGIPHISTQHSTLSTAHESGLGHFMFRMCRVRVHKDYNFAESLTNTPHPRYVSIVHAMHGPTSHPHSATPTGRLRRAETPPRPHWTKSTRESDMMTMPKMSQAVVLTGSFM
eukprot:scaffold93854_cov81-Phaeocystis_antarctica.AAC.3